MALLQVQDTVRVISIAVQANIPVHAQGEPGAGKTRTTEALGAEIERVTGKPFPVVVLKPSHMNDASDIVGLPYREGGVTKYAQMEWVARLINGGLLVFDEANTANIQIRSACLSVVQDGMVGTTPIKAARMLITNPSDMIVGALDFDPPMANRLLHLKWEGLNASAWAEGMVRGFPTDFPIVDQSLAAASLVSCKAMIGGFVQARPDLLAKLPADDKAKSGPWPSRRTWDLTAQYLAGARGAGYGPTSQIAFLGVSGLVGDGAAGEFAKWLTLADLPDPEALLANPAGYRIPKRGDLVYAVLTGVAGAAAANLTRERFDAAWQIIAATTASHKDAAVIAGTLLAKANNARQPKERHPNPPLVAELLNIAAAIAELGRK